MDELLERDTKLDQFSVLNKDMYKKCDSLTEQNKILTDNLNNQKQQHNSEIQKRKEAE